MLRPWLSSKLFSLRSREWRSSDRSEGFKFITAKRGSDTGYLSDVVPAAGLIPPGPLVPRHLLPGAVMSAKRYSSECNDCSYTRNICCNVMGNIYRNSDVGVDIELTSVAS